MQIIRFENKLWRHSAMKEAIIEMNIQIFVENTRL